jgi:SAM-dependent methyltransferase
MILPPGTILQILYLKERLRDVQPGRFIEVGVGQGHLSAMLLDMGWEGTGYELDADSANAARERNREAIAAGRYSVVEGSWLDSPAPARADLVLSCMVLEHLDDRDEERYLLQCRQSLADAGMAILLVPGSPGDWGIEDEIAGHYRRYTAASLKDRIERTGLVVRHVAGLTYPLSNLLLPVSNFLVRRAEGDKVAMDMQGRTQASGRREVTGKTWFPSPARVILNEFCLYPFHILQKILSRASRALVVYAEYTKPGTNP